MLEQPSTQKTNKGRSVGVALGQYWRTRSWRAAPSITLSGQIRGYPTFHGRLCKWIWSHTELCGVHTGTSINNVTMYQTDQSGQHFVYLTTKSANFSALQMTSLRWGSHWWTLETPNHWKCGQAMNIILWICIPDHFLWKATMKRHNVFLYLKYTHIMRTFLLNWNYTQEASHSEAHFLSKRTNIRSIVENYAAFG